MQAPQDISPLNSIRRKERELAQRIRTAMSEAEAKVAGARRRAALIREEAEREGLREAEEFFQRRRAEAEAEANRIRAGGQKEAERIRRTGPEQVERAVQAIIEFVLPGER